MFQEDGGQTRPAGVRLKAPVLDSAPERARRLKGMEIRLQGGGGVK